MLAQVSVASYACPSMSDQAVAPATASTESSSQATLMSGMVMPAAGPSRIADVVGLLDADAPAQCVEHFRFGQQSNATTPATAVHAAFLLPFCAILPAPAATMLALSRAAFVRPMATVAPPPLAILHCCFRL
ncbi:MAG: hypothetical protein ABJA61_09475 [Caldimonas sp.]